MVTVLSQLGPDGAARIAVAAPVGVEVIDVPMHGEIALDVRGDVLVAPAKYTDNLDEALGRGVRWFHEFGTGVDGLPLDDLFARDGLTLTCSRGASAIPISEWVLAQMLAFEKRLPDAWLHEPPATWNLGFGLGELHGRMLGLVGLGGIGTRVAALARAFGMQVTVARRRPEPSGLDGVEVAPLDDVLAMADHLVLAAPATPATHHLLDGEAFSRLRPGAHLVNVGRGALIDQDALRVALDEGIVACASLDVCDPEPLPAGHWMWSHPSIRLSPHISWSSPHGLERIMDGFLANLDRYVIGAALEGVVDPIEGY